MKLSKQNINDVLDTVKNILYGQCSLAIDFVRNDDMPEWHRTAAEFVQHNIELLTEKLQEMDIK